MGDGYLLLLCLVLCGTIVAAAPTRNLATNGSFETPDPADPTRPAGYTAGRVPPSGDNVKMTWEEEGVLGHRCIALETTDSSGNGYWETTVSVKPGTAYTIAFYYKCRDIGMPAATTGDPAYNHARPGGPNLELGVGTDDPSYTDPGKPTNWTDIGISVGPVGGTYLPVATDWRYVWQDVTTRPDQTRLRVRLRLFCYAQKVWFDNLSVSEAATTPKPPPVKSSGWTAANTTTPHRSAAPAISGPTRPELRGQTLYVNAKPFFPIGLYAYCCTPTDGRFREDALAEATAAGYDMLLNTALVPPDDTVADLDMLSQHGMYGLLNISRDMKGAVSPEAAREALTVQGQAQWRDHPSTIGYWADDPENLENTEGGPIPASTLTLLENTRRVLQEHSPGYPLVWAVSNLPRLPAAAPTADILLSYRYPVPIYHPQMIYGFTMAYALSVIGDKPLWFNSQGLDLGESAKLKSEQFRPTPAEMPAMAFYSVIEGARGWSLYAANLTKERHPEHWAMAMLMGRQMREIAPALAEGKAGSTARLQPGTLNGSIYFREIELNGEHTLIAVNMSGAAVHVRWEFKRPARLAALFEDRMMARAAKHVLEDFEPYQVHIYRWR